MKQVFFFLICCYVFTFPQAAVGQSQVRAFTKTLILMGSRFEITAVAEEDSLAWQAIEAAVVEIERIEALISSWKSSSQTTQINQQAGKQPVKVEAELYYLIKRSQKISTLTQGAFDISFASINKLWRFDGSMRQLPDSAAVAASVSLIDWREIQLNDRDTTVFLVKPGMRIGFGAIGKGYAANQAKQIMQDKGISSGLVNAGGDLIAWGLRPQGEPWSVGIADPEQPQKIFAQLHIKNQAVVTSGSYERFVEFNGIRYAHIIDPRTGWPVQQLKSVTVICQDAELADALATSVFILGPQTGLTLINRLRGISCLIVTSDDKIIQSHNLDLQHQRND